jgi:mRNA interferase RelE/StbE
VYRVQVLDPAIRDLQRLDKATARMVVKRIEWFAANLERCTPVPLHGKLAGLFKLRAGDYRVVYEICHSEHLPLVHMVGHRSDIYRRRP